MSFVLENIVHNKRVSTFIHGKNCENCSECIYCKTWCHVLNILFSEQKQKSNLFGGDSTNCLVRKTSRDYER